MAEVTPARRKALIRKLAASPAADTLKSCTADWCGHQDERERSRVQERIACLLEGFFYAEGLSAQVAIPLSTWMLADLEKAKDYRLPAKEWLEQALNC